MKNILVVAQKGGVGKSLIADELAFSLSRCGVPFSFYDLDSQGGTLHSSNTKEGAKVAVIDTPGALQADLGKWLTQADAVIVPTRAAGRDIPPLLRIIDLVNEKCDKHIKFYVVVNFWNRYSATRDFIEWLSMKGIKDILLIPQSEAITQASIAGLSVVEYAPNSAATTAIKKVCNRVCSDLGLPTEEQ